jgi:hypothetical protein
LHRETSVPGCGRSKAGLFARSVVRRETTISGSVCGKASLQLGGVELGQATMSRGGRSKAGLFPRFVFRRETAIPRGGRGKVGKVGLFARSILGCETIISGSVCGPDSLQLGGVELG